jgi:hypothetical protein
MSIWRNIALISLGTLLVTAPIMASEPMRISLGDASESYFLDITLPAAPWSWDIGGLTINDGQITERVVLPASDVGGQPQEGLVLKHYPNMTCARLDGMDFAEATILDLQGRFPGAAVTELRCTPSERYVLFRDSERGQSGLVRLTQAPTGWFEIAYVQFLPSGDDAWLAWQEAVGAATLSQPEELSIDDSTLDSIGPIQLALPIRDSGSKVVELAGYLEAEPYRHEDLEREMWAISGEDEEDEYAPSGYLYEEQAPIPVEVVEDDGYDENNEFPQPDLIQEISLLEEALELAFIEAQAPHVTYTQPPPMVMSPVVIMTTEAEWPLYFVDVPCSYYSSPTCATPVNPCPRTVRRYHRRPSVQREYGPPLCEVCSKRRSRRR